MAINMLSENEYIQCPNCKGLQFMESDCFTLKKQETASGVKLVKTVTSKGYVCAKCGTNITPLVKDYKIIKK